MGKTVTKVKTNPNGANQFIYDPRQALLWKFYTNVKEKSTFGNAYQSALKAGYSKGTAAQITTFNWFIEKCRRMNMLDKAERVLDEALELPSKVQAMGAFGPIFNKKQERVKGKNGKYKIKTVNGEPVLVFSTGLLKIKTDVGKFVAETKGKRKGYTKSLDLTSGGKAINFKSIDENQLLKIARRIANGNTAVA